MRSKEKGLDRFVLLPEVIVRRPCFDYSDCVPVPMVAIGNPQFMEALYYASPKLYEELLKFGDGSLSAKDTKRMERTIYKYYSRMCYRCTPFGLFSLCGVGRYGAAMKLSPSETVASISLPPELIHKYTRLYIKECPPEARMDLRVVANRTALRCGTKGDRISFRLRNGADEVRKAYLPLTSILKAVLRHTVNPVSIADLKERLMAEFEIDEAALTGYIRDLIAKSVLMTELDLSVDNNLSFDSLISRIKKQGISVTKNVETIRALDALVSSLNADNTGSKERINTIREFMQSNGKESGLEKLNVNYYGFGYEVPESLKDTVIKMLCLFWRFDAVLRDGMSTFRRKFSERYEKREVPLLEALDDVVGIGSESEFFPHSPFMNAARRDMSRQGSSAGMNVSLSLFEKVVLEKMMASGAPGNQSNITISEKDLLALPKGVAMDSLNRDNLPYSLSCMYKIVGLKGGQPVISDVQFSGRSAASMLTRFASENREIRNLVESIMRQEQESYPSDTLLAEVSHITKPSLANIQVRPLLRDYAIPFVAFPSTGASSSPAPAHITATPSIAHSDGSLENPQTVFIYPDDLTLKIVNNRLTLRSKSLNKEVMPCLTTAYNPYFNSSPIYKFLNEIQHQYSISSLTLGVQGLLQLFSHVPRVEFENVILSPECWKVSTDKFMENGKLSSGALADWCEEVKAPRFLKFSRKDNFLVIDRESELSVEAFLDEIKKEKSVTLTEFLPLATDMEHYEAIAEIIQPIVIKR